MSERPKTIHKNHRPRRPNIAALSFIRLLHPPPQTPSLAQTISALRHSASNRCSHLHPVNPILVTFIGSNRCTIPQRSTYTTGASVNTADYHTPPLDAAVSTPSVTKRHLIQSIPPVTRLTAAVIPSSFFPHHLQNSNRCIQVNRFN